MSRRNATAPKRRLAVFLPLIIFGALALLFLFRLYAGDPQRLPSALINKMAPLTNLPPLAELTAQGRPVPGLAADMFKGEVSILNIFASWCIPCRDEHPVLMKLADQKAVRIYGLNYKDRPEAAATFLRDLGNPYGAVGVDASGRMGIEWGVYGVPETFVINANGLITYKHVGPLTEASVKNILLPEIDKARKMLAKP